MEHIPHSPGAEAAEAGKYNRHYLNTVFLFQPVFFAHSIYKSNCHDHKDQPFIRAQGDLLPGFTGL